MARQWWDLSGDAERDAERSTERLRALEEAGGPFSLPGHADRVRRNRAKGDAQAEEDAKRLASEQQELEQAQDILARMRDGKKVSEQDELNARRTVERILGTRAKKGPKAQGWARGMRSFVIIGFGGLALFNYKQILGVLDGSASTHVEERPPPAAAPPPAAETPLTPAPPSAALQDVVAHQAEYDQLQLHGMLLQSMTFVSLHPEDYPTCERVYHCGDANYGASKYCFAVCAHAHGHSVP
jgi:hypothetical protein